MTKDDTIAEIQNRIKRHEDRSVQLADRAESGYLSSSEATLFFIVASDHAGQVIAYKECIKFIKELDEDNDLIERLALLLEHEHKCSGYDQVHKTVCDTCRTIREARTLLVKSAIEREREGE
jgi:hypothetical protein